MNIKVGCDLISLKRFDEICRSRGKDFLDKVFFQDEIRMAKSRESLAGYFALKEAVFKAIGLNPSQIRIFKHATGKPNVQILHDIEKNIISSDVSISHDADFAIAISTFLLNGDI